MEKGVRVLPTLFTAALAFGAFLVTLLSTPLLIRSARSKGITGRDVNKTNRPEVANMGGFAVFLGIACALSLFVLVVTFQDRDSHSLSLSLAALASIAIIALVGVFDDLFKLSWKTKLLTPALAALPLVAITAGDTTMTLPFVGWIDVGYAYTFLLIPIGVSGAANAVNMVAGYNGVEAGIGAIMSVFLLAIAVQSGNWVAAAILASCLGACLAFLVFNWNPARVFPGDVGTLVIGACIASAVIIGNMEKYGLILFLPAFFELASTLFYGAQGIKRRALCHNPVIAADGRLSPPKGAEHYTLFYWILSKKPMKETALVVSVLALYALCGVLALAVYFYKL
jgi:UDP-N-acetylglucosamine--dolichyl-phosphate N-acetylglucosaminephosphotransferase